MESILACAVLVAIGAALIWAERKYGAAAPLAALAFATGVILLLMGLINPGVVFICTSLLLGTMARPIRLLTQILDAQKTPAAPQAAIYCPKCEKPSPAEASCCTACGYVLA